MSAFVDSLLDLLMPLREVSARRMFGGYGIYKDGIMFGLVAHDRLYIRTDDENKDAFITRGCEPFVFGERDGKAIVSRYFEPPESAFTNAQKMNPWAMLGIQASERAPKKKVHASKSKVQGSLKPQAPKAKKRAR